jgi:flagellar hook-basal body complex protein FliE
MTKINHFQPLFHLGTKTNKAQDEKAAPTESFSSVLSESLQKVNGLQKDAELMTNKLITGEVNDVHQVMIATQKASIALQLTVEVRNKVIESYQEMMRMQV